MSPWIKVQESMACMGVFEFDLKDDESGNRYIKEGISLFGNIGVEIYAYDKFDGARNKNGIRFQKLIFDGQTVFEQSIDKINFGLTRNILVHTNFKRSKEGGRRFNKLYVDNGNLLDFYASNKQQGILQVFDPLSHQIDIRLQDGYGNVSQVALRVNNRTFKRERITKNTYGLDVDGYDINKNILEVESDGVCEAMFYLDGERVIVPQSYYTLSSSNYLWDLNIGIPDSAIACGDTIVFNISNLIPSKQKVKWNHKHIEVALQRTHYLILPI